MAKPKHEYDHIDFYKRIEQLAMKGFIRTRKECRTELGKNKR